MNCRPTSFPKRSLCRAIGTATAALALLLPAAPLLAQDDSMVIEEITVTARKREESLADVPVSITAFSSDDIIAGDLTGLDDVSTLTAGFQFFDQGNQQPGRYNTQLQFRGLTTAQFSPSFATGALFIDGIYVLNGGTSLSLNDLERIEVIKGPQSAYFSRNTFGGAVNLITRDPSMEEFGGELILSNTNRSNFDGSVFVEGPIVSDKLAFSASLRRYDKRGHFRATDGGRLGNEETTSINAVLLWEPTDTLSFKLRYADSEDDDGAPAQAFVSGLLDDSCTGTTVNSAEGPASPQRYICGQVPDFNSAGSVIGAIGSANTILPDSFAGLTDPNTLLAGTPNIDRVGLIRETERLSLQVSYDFNDDYNLEFVAASNEQGANWIRDFDLTDRIGWFSRDPQFLEDESYELRLTGPQDGRVRWLVGVNRYTQEFAASGGGGDAATGCFSLAPTLTDDSSTCIPGLVLLFPNSLQQTDEADVFGIFASVDIDITDQLTLILEGRQQEDEITKGAGLLNPGQPILTESFDDFLPRVIVRYQPTDNTTFFASYSEGQIAGDFNTFFINADDRERAQYLAIDPRVSEALPAETLDALELGVKHSFWDNRAQVNFSIYRYEWAAIKGRSSFLINETCRAPDIGTPGCQTELGLGIGDPKQILDADGNLTPFFNSRNILLPGDATITGAEIESLFLPFEGTSVAINVAYINAEYDDYEFNFVAPIAGFSQMAGNQTPRQPEWSGNISVTQDFQLAGYDAYVRGDWRYQGKSFVDESNLAFIDSYSVLDLRGGVNINNWLVELYIRNAADEDAWATGARWTDFSSPTQFAFLTAKQGVALSPLDKREVGLRAVFRF
ncbi:MAG: TonB-dependent receptor [Pseudomonadota bacterium]